jgi:predicted aspartyl protease
MPDGSRRFPPPLRADKIPGGYVVRDANGWALARAPLFWLSLVATTQEQIMVTGFFAPQRDNAPSGFWSPMLRASLSNSVDPAKVNIVATDLLALVDTGADACFIDDRLAQQFGLPVRRQIEIVTGTGKATASVYRGQIVLQDDTKLSMAMVGSNFEQNGFRHRLLIGMEGLRFFELRMHRPSHQFSLQWFPPPLVQVRSRLYEQAPRNTLDPRSRSRLSPLAPFAYSSFHPLIDRTSGPVAMALWRPLAV